MKKIVLVLSYLFIIPTVFFTTLALQSFTKAESSALLRQIKMLEEALFFTNFEKEIENQNIEKLIGSNKSENLAKVQQLRAATSEIRQYIHSIRTKLITETGGYVNADPRQIYVGANDIEKTEIIMLGTGDAKNGMGYSLKAELNKYVDRVNATLPAGEPKFMYIALDPKNDLGMTDLNQKDKDFPTYYFKGTPMVMVMAELSKFELNVLSYERRCLKTFADKSGDQKGAPKTIQPVVIPTSRTVTAGAVYEAEIFLTGASIDGALAITSRGANVPVDPITQRGKVSFVTSLGSDDGSGISKQELRYTMSFKFKGRDTVILGKEEFFVKKPLVKINSASRNILYKDCGNEMSVTIPDLGDQYKPSFAGTGAEVIKGVEKGSLVIVPNQENVELKITNSENYIGTELFKAIAPPDPTIQILVEDKPIDKKQGLEITKTKLAKIKATGDPAFQNLFPKDARYKVVEWQCILVRGRRPVRAVVFTDEAVDLTDVMSYASPGDRLIIEVNKVARTNFLNKSTLINNYSSVITIHLN
jgi:gliding motility-associated protein GldM